MDTLTPDRSCLGLSYSVLADLRQGVGPALLQYAKPILPTLSAKWLLKYGMVLSELNLSRMLFYVRAFLYAQIFMTLSRHLSWRHFICIYLNLEPSLLVMANGPMKCRPACTYQAKANHVYL